MDISVTVTVHSKLVRIGQDQAHTARIQVNILDSRHECDIDFSRGMSHSTSIEQV